MVNKAVQKLSKDELVDSIQSPFSVTGIDNEELLSQLLTYGEKEQVTPILDYFIRDNKMLIEVYLNTAEHSAEAREWVNIGPLKT